MTELRRMSSLDRQHACASSAADSDYNLEDEFNEPAAEGNAVHECMAFHVHRLDPDLEEIAAVHKVSVDKLEVLYDYGKLAWSKIFRHFPEPTAEYRVQTEITQGTMDVMHHDGLTAIVGDWKSGRVRSSHRHQVTGYAHGLWKERGMPESGVIKGVEIWLRFKEFEVFDLTEADLIAWEKKQAALESRIGIDWNPGDHCGFCPHRLSCIPHRDHLSKSASLMVQQTGSLGFESRVALADALVDVRQLERAIKEYKATLKAELLNGSITRSDGTMLFLEEKKKDRIDAFIAWPILKEYGFTDEVLNECVKINKGAVTKAARDMSGRRHGAKAKAERVILAQLREGGAITKDFSYQVGEARPVIKIGESE